MLNTCINQALTSTRWHVAFGLCCHSNETCAPIANLTNSAQLGGTPTISKLVCAIVWQCGEGQTQADWQTHRRMWPAYISSHLILMQNVTRHVLAIILRSLFVARTAPVEARSPDCRSNVENAPRRQPISGEPATPTSHIWRTILRTPPVTRQSPASSARRPRPAGRSHYVVISRDGRKLVTRIRVMLP